MMHWESVKSDKFSVFRAAVPGGWLVKCHLDRRGLDGEGDTATGMLDAQARHLQTVLFRIERTLHELRESSQTGNLVFLPDREHQWDGTSAKVAPEMRLGG
jgi:hypothetical protein